MNRRDTIIIAVLINAGLLVLLFVTSLKTPEAVKVTAPEVAKVEKVAPLPPPPKQNLVQAETPKKVEVVAKVSEPKVEPKVEPVKEVVAVEKKAEVKAQKVTVQKGDVLEKIAKRHGTTVKEIVQLNNLAGTNLRIGQQLLLPPSTQRAVASVEKIAGDAKFYIVKDGDNLWKIAINNHMKVDELLRLNNLDEQKAKRLRPGDKLIIK
ncbi:MAG: LysM peptidoglycan-binding domain-containing protein [Simkaniaceae bacterium]|nr:LysM peptidoglycan-binding domain-containing protein [Simkaniaceae bacterium]